MRKNRPFPTDLVLPKALALKRLVYDHDGLKIVFWGFDPKEPGEYELIFSPNPISVRFMDEGLYMKSDWRLTPFDPLRIVENSDFLKWVAQESAGIIEPERYVHTALLTEDVWIDVIDWAAPKLLYKPGS